MDNVYEEEKAPLNGGPQGRPKRSMGRNSRPEYLRWMFPSQRQTSTRIDNANPSRTEAESKINDPGTLDIFGVSQSQSLSRSRGESDALPALDYGTLSAMFGLRPLDAPITPSGTDPSADREGSQNTFFGVFVPCISTIFGIIGFLRLGYIIGTIGFYATAGVITTVFFITLLTVLSLCALVTHGSTSDSGLYSAVINATSKELRFALGIMLFFAYLAGIGLYLLGFAEATRAYLHLNATSTIFTWNPPGSWVTVLIASILLLLMLLLCWRRVSLGVYVPTVCFVMIAMSIFTSLISLSVSTSDPASGHTAFSWKTLEKNWAPEKQLSFNDLFSMLVMFFPGFTGVIAGTNPSGNLRNAKISIPKGTISAVTVAWIVYLLIGLVIASTCDRRKLRENVFILMTVVEGNAGIPVVYAGITFGAISSAVSEMIAASRVLQMTFLTMVQIFRGAQTTSGVQCRASDLCLLVNFLLLTDVLHFLQSVANAQYDLLSMERSNQFPGFGVSPGTITLHQCILVTWALVQAGVLVGNLNLYIPVVTGCFLLTYCAINLICIIREVSDEEFHPFFKMYSKWTALLGFILSWAFLVLSTALVTSIIFLCLFLIILFARWRSRQLARQNLGGAATTRSRDVVTPSPNVVTSNTIKKIADKWEEQRSRVITEKVHMAVSHVRDALDMRTASALSTSAASGDSDRAKTMAALHARRIFHGLKLIRTLNMVVYMAVYFVEPPDWCQRTGASCGDPTIVLSWGIPRLSLTASSLVQYSCLLLFGGELWLKQFFMGKRAFWSNRWYLAQVILLLLHWICCTVTMLDPRQVSFSPFIRPLLLVTLSGRLRRAFSNLFMILPSFLSCMVPLTLLVIFYACFGVLLFHGSEEGQENFRSLGDAINNLIILLTTANYPDIMMPAYNASRYSCLFFISFLLLGLFYFMNLVLATIYDKYKQQLSIDAANFRKRRMASLNAAFRLLDIRRTGLLEYSICWVLIMELKRPLISMFDWSASSIKVRRSIHLLKIMYEDEPKGVSRARFGQLVAAMKLSRSRDQKNDREDGGWLVELLGLRPESRLRQLATSLTFERVIDCVILINLVVIVIELAIGAIDSDMGVIKTWEFVHNSFTAIYAIEMMYKIGIRGFLPYWEEPRNRFDCVVTIVLLFVMFSGLLLPANNDRAFLEVVRMQLGLRLLRCLRLLVALRRSSNIFSTFIALVPACATLLGMMLATIAFYAALGVAVFGGIIYKGNPRLEGTAFHEANYYANNFNDFASAVVTLFELLVVNNWFVIMEGVVAATSRWSRLYFISFYFLAVVMVLNLVVAFIIEAYMAREQENIARSLSGERSASNSSESGLRSEGDNLSFASVDDQDVTIEQAL